MAKSIEQFIAQIYRRSNSVQSLRKYTQVIRQFFAEYPKEPDKITRADVEAFLELPSQGQQNRGGAVMNATRNLRLTVLSSFYQYAATYTIASPDGQLAPLLQRPSPTIGVTRGRPNRSYKAMTSEELARFFSCIPKDTAQGLRDRALFLTFWWTARRSSEILNLKWGDIERATIVETDGTRREAWQYRWYGKGYSTQQDVAELPALAKAAIDAYLLASGRIATIRPGDYVFAGTRNMAQQKGSQPMGSAHVNKTIKRYALLAGLDAERLSIHSFRHSAARIRYENCSDVREVQKILRHSSLHTTDIYLRQIITPADNGARLLEQRFSGF